LIVLASNTKKKKFEYPDWQTLMKP